MKKVAEQILAMTEYWNNLQNIFFVQIRIAINIGENAQIVAYIQTSLYFTPQFLNP